MIKYIDIEQDAHGNWYEVNQEQPDLLADLVGGLLLTGGAIIASLAIAGIVPAILPGIEHNTNRPGDPLGGLLRLANNLTDGLGITGVSRRAPLTPEQMREYNRAADHHELTRKRYIDPVTGEWKQL